MLRIITAIGFILSFTMGQAFAHEAAHTDEQAQLKGIVDNLLKDNNSFVKSHNSGYFKPFTDGQHPRATIVTCSDSRVHMAAMDKTPDNDLFVIRNIGNQLGTAEGSIEYGVHHLHTPLLIFVGHSACGAIKAASGDYTKESDAIKRELDSIKITKGGDWMEGVKTNVNNQVADSVKKFAEEIKEGKLTVIGAVYDFRNDLKQGQGRLVITNINGESDAAKVKANPLLSMK
jgi:carbonic anhydrase